MYPKQGFFGYLFSVCIDGLLYIDLHILSGYSDDILRILIHCIKRFNHVYTFRRIYLHEFIYNFKALSPTEHHVENIK